MSLPEQIRSALLEETAVTGSCGVLLSDGVDSNSLLAALLRNKARPFIFSFRLTGRRSKDWQSAWSTADQLGLPFFDIELPTDVETITQDVSRAILQYNLSKKADIECAVPVFRVVERAAELGVKNLFSGAAADGHFGLSRKAMIAVADGNRDKPAWMEKFRALYFSRPNPAQVRTTAEFARERGINLFAPYVSARFLEIFRGYSWADLNTPRQKEPVRVAFPELGEWGVGSRHINLQLGDSGIADNYRKLLDSPLNTRGWKSPVGIYNEIRRRGGTATPLFAEAG